MVQDVLFLLKLKLLQKSNADIFRQKSDRRWIMWCYGVVVTAFRVLTAVLIRASGKTIQHSTFVIQRLQTFVKNFVTNAFMNRFFLHWNVYHIYVERRLESSRDNNRSVNRSKTRLIIVIIIIIIFV